MHEDKPKPFIEGICFICGKPCDAEHYVHRECAIAFDEELSRRRAEAMAARREKAAAGKLT